MVSADGSGTAVGLPGGREGWNQAWRGPLRGALSFLRDQAAALFEEAGAELFENPWAARDGYIERVLPGEVARPFSLTPCA